MSSLPPPLPRFVPTLTEVVEPSFLTPILNNGVSQQQELMDSLKLHLTAMIEHRLRDFGEVAIRTLLSEQLQMLSNNLKLELDETINQFLHQTYSSNFDQYKQK